MKKYVAHAETAANAIALVACWLCVAFLASWAYHHAVVPDWRDLHAATLTEAISGIEAMARPAMTACLAVAAAAAAAVIALCAAEGTWWITRRLQASSG